MNKLQLVVNMDNTLCIDMYSDNVFSGEFPTQLSELCDYVEQQTQKQLRQHPFRIGTCSCCVHTIVSNRDKGMEFKCQNCDKNAKLQEIISEEAKHILKNFCELRKIETISLDGQYAEILVILPNDFSETKLLTQILSAYGFIPKEKQGKDYTFLVTMGISKGWINQTHNLAAYAQAELTEYDESYDGFIPRVEELDRCIRKCFESVYTVSKLVPIAKDTTNPRTKEEIEMEIQRLVKEKKFEEALELSRKLQ